MVEKKKTMPPRLTFDTGGEGTDGSARVVVVSAIDGAVVLALQLPASALDVGALQWSACGRCHLKKKNVCC
jgi:hypothetical protein